MAGIPQMRPERCQDTRTTIGRMCGYIRCDRKIAQHVGVGEGFVASIRKALPDHRDVKRRTNRVAQHSLLIDSPEAEKGAGEYLAFRLATRKSSDRLAAALGAVK